MKILGIFFKFLFKLSVFANLILCVSCATHFADVYPSLAYDRTLKIFDPTIGKFIWRSQQHLHTGYTRLFNSAGFDTHNIKYELVLVEDNEDRVEIHIRTWGDSHPVYRLATHHKHGSLIVKLSQRWTCKIDFASKQCELFIFEMSIDDAITDSCNGKGMDIGSGSFIRLDGEKWTNIWITAAALQGFLSKARATGAKIGKPCFVKV